MTEISARNRARRWSIAKRLALLHIVAVFINYGVIGGLLYAQRVELRERRENRELSDEITSIKTMLRETNGKELLDYEIWAQLHEPKGSSMYIRILDPQGRVIVQSARMESILPRRAFPPREGGGKGYLWRNESGDHFTIKTVNLPARTLLGPGCVLQIGTDSNDEMAFQKQLRWTLSLFGCAGLILAFVCARFIVKLGLKPLDEISRIARNITRRQLHTRIDETILPAELTSLASSFNTMLVRLAESFDRLSHYSANLAHELRTPINTLMLEADIALARERSPEEYRRVISSSLEEYQRLSSMIDRLLFLAKADHEGDELDRQRLNLEEEIEDVIDYFAEAASEAGIALGGTGAGTVFADQTLFRRAVSNLVTNAIAHTPAGGTVAVAVAEETTAAKVTVTDSGCGLEEKHLPRVFDRFYRVDEGGMKKEGSGLGLAIVKSIMDMHGGSVAISSRLGKGTSVTLEFPSTAVQSP